MLQFAVTIFLSAFLLFQVQPLIAKAILPWFGGSAAVWATCMLFFQTVLLLGYLYAHGLTSHLTPRRQRIVHIVLLAACLLALPIVPNPAWKPDSPDAPIGRILALLALTVGLPYFALSSTGPLLQAWFVQAQPNKSPYRLFALSNLGSMLALLSYPPLVEPNLTLRHQELAWGVAFGVFALMCALTGWRNPAVAGAVLQQDQAERGPAPWGRLWFWVALATVPSMLLLAVTTQLSMDVAPIPFLWVLPLALYLLSFILCFDAAGWYKRTVYLALMPVALVAILWLGQESPVDRPGVRASISIFAAGFFVVCMVCHGELARRKPEPSRLTIYYLAIAIGGALGGVFVGIVSPVLFNAYYEFPLAIGFAGLLWLSVLFRESDWPFRRDWLGWPSIFALAIAAFLLGYVVRSMRDSVKGSMYVGRNFYGELRVQQFNNVYDWDGYRSLVHGSINHGEQYTHPARRKEPAAYYCPDGGIGRLMATRVVGNPQKVAIIGLGTGTLATYARVGDVYRYYEINPQVQQVANEYFTYLKDSEVPVQVALGDARLTLEKQPPQGFDLIALDAFSSDSIPVHLLTKEAMELYFRHLAPDGVLAVHISNRYINLEPVVERAANALGKRAWVVETEDDKDGNCYGTTWVLVTARDNLFNRDEFRQSGKPPKTAPWLKLWTDDYSNIYRVLK